MNLTPRAAAQIPRCGSANFPKINMKERFYMKKLLKRLLPAAMALSMIFSMSATALAADDLLPQDAGSLA